MLMRFIHGVLYYGKDALSLIGGAQTVCIGSFLAVAVIFIPCLLKILLKKPPKLSSDLALALSRTALPERAYREITKALLFLSLLAVGIDAFTPPSVFAKVEVTVGYLALFLALRYVLSLLLLWAAHGVNGKLAFLYRLTRAAEERRVKVRLDAERAERQTAKRVEEAALNAPRVCPPLKREELKENGKTPNFTEREALINSAPLQGSYAENESKGEEGEPLPSPAPSAVPALMRRAEEGDSDVEPLFAAQDISREGVNDLLSRASALPLSEADALRLKKIELAVRDALSDTRPEQAAISSLLAAVMKLLAKYEGVA